MNKSCWKMGSGVKRRSCTVSAHAPHFGSPAHFLRSLFPFPSIHFAFAFSSVGPFLGTCTTKAGLAVKAKNLPPPPHHTFPHFILSPTLHSRTRLRLSNPPNRPHPFHSASAAHAACAIQSTTVNISLCFHSFPFLTVGLHGLFRESQSTLAHVDLQLRRYDPPIENFAPSVLDSDHYCQFLKLLVSAPVLREPSCPTTPTEA